MRQPLKHYGIAIAVTAAAILLRWLVDPVMGDSLPLVTLFGAVALVVWIGGYRPAALVAILGYFASAYLFILPRGEVGLTTFANVVGLIAYAFTCLLIILIGESMRRAGAAAGERGELLQVTLHSIGDAVITTDIEGRVTSLNRVAETLTGWPKAAAIGKPLETVFRIINEQGREPAESPAMRALREGAIVGLANHTILVARDSSERTIDDSAAPIRDEQGKVSGCVLVFRDVSDKRQLEKQAASRLVDARTLASIVESSDDAIVSKSLEGIIQSWNAAAERVFGYTADQAVGKHISLVIPPERIAEEDHIIASLRAGRRVDHFVTERVRSDGRRIHVSLTISPVKDEAGKVIGASKIVRDVTQQRAAEDRERKLLADAVASNAKFRALFDQGALFAVILDVDGTIVEPNRRSLEGCGYAREQVVGRPFWEGPWWTSSAALIDEARTAVAEAAAGKSVRAEMPYVVADGRERTIDMTILSVRDETGRTLFLAAMGSDVTERRQLEDELRNLAADLSEVDRRKNEFLATLSHELRNPLAPLRNMVEVLQRAEGDPGTVRRALDTMERQLGQLVRLVDDLLDLNRITHDRIELRKAHVDVASIVRDVVHAARPLTEEMGHDVQLAVEAEPLYVHGDAVRLTQVFGNLLNNGNKYTPRGGTIRVTVRHRADAAEIAFADNGIGIAADHLDRIFEMFVQVDRATEVSQTGLGVGLTLANRLVQLHGGSIEAKSAGVGRGSEFVVRLPIAAERPGTETPAVPTPQTTRTYRVLIVDDNLDAGSSLALLLEIAGHQTSRAHDGPSALDAAETERPEVILLDIGLPTLNGYEVCRRIRKRPWGSSVLVIALTGWGQEEDRRRSHEAGFDGHLVKPVEYAELMTLLGRLQT